jgi:hypothetical protein
MTRIVCTDFLNMIYNNINYAANMTYSILHIRAAAILSVFYFVPL